MQANTNALFMNVFVVRFALYKRLCIKGYDEVSVAHPGSQSFLFSMLSDM